MILILFNELKVCFGLYWLIIWIEKVMYFISIRNILNLINIFIIECKSLFIVFY